MTKPDSGAVYLGVDLGSTAIKIVGVNGAGDILFNDLIRTNPQNILNINSIDYRKYSDNPVKSICATGYGRKNLFEANCASPEIICQARGIIHLYEGVGTIIDVGGQDTKVIEVAKSKVVNFYMNDKCAAGTGRFIEKVADILGLSLKEMSTMKIEDNDVVPITSVCAVFAETEIISLIAKNTNISRIINSLYYSLANRLANNVRAFGLKDKVVFTGGLGVHERFIYWLQEVLKCKIIVPASPQFSAALGAALIGKELKQNEDGL